MSEPMSNFTPRAQQVLALARKEADRFHHNYVGTEHLLLGLINLGQGVAVNVLQKMGLDLDTVRQAVDEQVGLGPEAKPSATPYTPRVKKSLLWLAKRPKDLTTVTWGRNIFFSVSSAKVRGLPHGFLSPSTWT